MKNPKTYITGVGAAALLLASAAFAEKPKSEDTAGIIYRHGNAYVVADGKATPIDQSTIKDGEMLTFDGRTVKAPEGITGVREGGRASEAAKTENKDEKPAKVKETEADPVKSSSTTGRGADVTTPTKKE